jgi:hypothetical protein
LPFEGYGRKEGRKDMEGGKYFREGVVSVSFLP